jgi:hypothetical protein
MRGVDAWLGLQCRVNVQRASEGQVSERFGQKLQRLVRTMNGLERKYNKAEGNVDPSFMDEMYEAQRLETEGFEAASDLLQACKDIRDFLRSHGYDTRIVQAAIAKAENSSGQARDK